VTIALNFADRLSGVGLYHSRYTVPVRK
jgi:hypothetical protein